MLVAASLVPLLGILAYLQIGGIKAMGEREKTRLKQGLSATAGQLAGAFRAELAALPAAVLLDSGAFGRSIVSGDWSRFAESLDAWKAYAIDPGLVKSMHLALHGEPEGDGRLLSWNGGSFAAEPDAKFALRILKLVARGQPGADPVPFDEGIDLFIVPLRREGGAHFVLALDRASLSSVLLPALAERHLFGTGEYRFRIYDRATTSTLFLSDPSASSVMFDKSDLTLPLFRGDFLLPLRSSQGQGGETRRIFIESSPVGEPAGSLASAFRVPPDAAPEAASDGKEARASPFLGLFRVTRIASESMGRPEEFRSQAKPPQPEARWVIEAVHREGSLAAAVRKATIGNAALSMAILVVLGIGLLILAETGRRARDLAERRSEFVATVSHELKTPLAVIGSAAENLADGIVRDEGKAERYGRAIREECLRLASMVEGLLLLSRMEAGLPARRERLDLRAVAKEAMEAYGAELTSSGFRVDLELPEYPLMVLGELESLRSALGNLIANVLKHASAGKYVGLIAKRAPARGFLFRATFGKGIGRSRRRERAVIRVDDRGPGLPRAERESAFDAFYRGSEARAAQRPGSGVGLSLVRRVVEAHGGSVRFISREEGGASVEIVLPLAEES